jgi:hypothetical protein
MKIVPLISLLNQLKVFHWQTKSYPQHVAFGSAYEKLDKLFDRFIEIHLSKYGNSNELKIYSIQVESLNSDTDVKKTLSNKKRDLLQYLRGELSTESDRDLLNICDEIEAELNQLQYLLNLN